MVQEKLETTMLFRLSYKEKEALSDICELLNCNKSNFVREAIREKIANELKYKII